MLPVQTVKVSCDINYMHYLTVIHALLAYYQWIIVGSVVVTLLVIAFVCYKVTKERSKIKGCKDKCHS